MLPNNHLDFITAIDPQFIDMMTQLRKEFIALDTKLRVISSLEPAEREGVARCLSLARTKFEAIDEMILALMEIKREEQKKHCNHVWIAEQAELLLQGYDIPMTQAMNKIKCSLCGVPQ